MPCKKKAWKIRPARVISGYDKEAHLIGGHIGTEHEDLESHQRRLSMELS